VKERAGGSSESSSDKLGEELSPRIRRIRGPDETAEPRRTREGKTEGKREREGERGSEGGRRIGRERETEKERMSGRKRSRPAGHADDTSIHGSTPLPAPPPAGLLPLFPLHPPSPSLPPTPVPRPPVRSSPSSSLPALHLRKPHALCPSIRRRLHLPSPASTSVSFP